MSGEEKLGDMAREEAVVKSRRAFSQVKGLGHPTEGILLAMM